MKDVVIYQVGRIDGGILKEVSFEIEGEVFEAKLSSFAIKRWCKNHGKPSRLVLLYPVSLPFQPHLLGNKGIDEGFARALKEVNEDSDRYLEAPHEFFRTHPHTKDAEDFLVLHSSGTYRTSTGHIFLEGQYTDIVLEILCYMIGEYLERPHVERYIIDISSGYNLYVVALMEAVRYFYVWLKLWSWSKKVPEMYIAVSDPIIPNIETTHKLFIDPFDTKAMFASPLRYDDIKDYRLSRKIYDRGEKEKKRRLQELLEGFVIVFSSIKNNVPLALYQFSYHSVEEICEFLKGLIGDVEGLLNRSYTSSPGLDKNAYLRVILTLGFYGGISRILGDNHVTRMVGDEGVELGRLRKVFGNIYRLFNLGLNDTILGNEVDRIVKGVGSTHGWEPLITLLKKYGDKVTQPQKRNFFAHAGFEGNITECRVDWCGKGDKRVYVRYGEGYCETVKKWLQRGVDE